MFRKSISSIYIYSGKLSLILSIILALLSYTVNGQQPKMIGRRVIQDKLEYNYDIPSDIIISTSTSTYVGDCNPGQPFVFPISTGSGRGVIGFKPRGVVENIVDISLSNSKGGSLQITGAPEPNFFAFEGVNEDDFMGVPFAAINDIQGLSVTATITCVLVTPIVVIYRDDSGESVNAVVSCDDEGSSQSVKLANGRMSRTSLRGESYGNPVTFESSTVNEIKIKKKHHGQSKTDTFLIHLDIGTTDDPIYKTFITQTCDRSSPNRRKLKQASIYSSYINGDGDVQITFQNLGDQSGNWLKYDARIGISLENTKSVYDIVDVTAILASDEPTLVVHGGWIRRAMGELGLIEHREGWDIVVVEAIVTDPQDKYSVIARLENMHPTKVSEDQAHRRAKLVMSPSYDEVNISDEMLQGRKPHRSDVRGLRTPLNGPHKKLLVHGYCSGRAWQYGIEQGHFDDYEEFLDLGKNRSHDEFARIILAFSEQKEIPGCGCIGHSQGGAACLHLYTYYWSCLDYSLTGSHIIQSVGTPYQGTPMASDLAALGALFGVGCGTNYDLSLSGAAAWLNGIPVAKRSEVHFYTTSFTDNVLLYDYCHLATDLLLSDPDDGVIEKSRGDLSGGNNKGHKTGWCHSTGMRDPAQYHDSVRNNEMNANAKY